MYRCQSKKWIKYFVRKIWFEHRIDTCIHCNIEDAIYAWLMKQIQQYGHNQLKLSVRIKLIRKYLILILILITNNKILFQRTYIYIYIT